MLHLRGTIQSLKKYRLFGTKKEKKNQPTNLNTIETSRNHLISICAKTKDSRIIESSFKGMIKKTKLKFNFRNDH